MSILITIRHSNIVQCGTSAFIEIQILILLLFGLSSKCRLTRYQARTLQFPCPIVFTLLRQLLLFPPLNPSDGELCRCTHIIDVCDTCDECWEKSSPDDYTPCSPFCEFEMLVYVFSLSYQLPFSLLLS
jgi:hypothetical protein